MIKVTLFNRFLEHKVFIIVVLIILALLITFSLLIIRLKNYLQTQTTTNQATPSSDIYYATTSGNPNWYLDTASPAANPILSTSGDSGISDIENDETYSSPTPYPLPTYTPAPTTAPVYVASSPPSCAGTPTAYNSEAVISSSSTMVNTAATITIELLDCNNNYATVNDNLTILLSNNDSTAKINDSSSPVTIQAQNGKATFTVNSQNTGTDTFVITDTSRSFTVTDPHNHNPSVTFTNNNSGNSHCTTAAGLANSWYSDVYPNPPISTNNGSITLIVDIRDCNQNLAPVADTLNISVNSGDPSTQINGGSLPQNVVTQNGEAQFTVSSQIVGTVTLSVQDTTSSFPVTNSNDNNPSITFNGSSNSSPTSTDTPTPTAASADTPTPTTTTNNTPTATNTPTPMSTTPTSTPVPNPTPS